VGVYGGNSGHSVFVERFAPGTYSSGVTYSVSGVPNGTYQNFAIIDVNQDGEIDVPDLSNVGGNQNGTAVVVNGSNVTNANLNLTSENVSSTPAVSTNYQQGNPNPYNMNFRIQWGVKRPVTATVISGPNLAVPLDMSVDQNQQIQTPNFPSGVSPVVGDTYQFHILFADGSSSTLPASVIAVLDNNSVAQSLGVNPNPPNSTTIPLFVWLPPLSPPATYYYDICVNNQNGASLNWCDYGNNGPGLPSSQTSDVYNSDHSASSLSLTSGTTYNWNVQVQDANQNTAQTSSTYTVP
jgi:hypothetical protein